MPKRGNSRHTVEVNLDALRRIGIHPTDDEKRLTLVPGAKAESDITDLLAQHRLAEKVLSIFTRFRWLFKCWPAKRVAGLVSALQTQGHRIIVTAAPAVEELAMIKDIQAELRQPVVDLSGQLSLKQLRR